MSYEDTKPIIEIKTALGEKVISPQKMETSGEKTYAEVEKYQEEVSALYLRGMSHGTISVAMTEKYGEGFSRPTISRMVGRLLRLWQEHYLENINQMMVAELEKLSHLEGVYWEAWERSLQNKEIRERFKVTGKDLPAEDMVLDEAIEDKKSKDGIVENQVSGIEKGGRKSMRKKGGFSREKEFERVEGSYGDVNFLMGIERCIEKRCKILGLFQDPSKTININWREEARRDGFDPDEIIDVIAQEFITAADENIKKLEEGQNVGERDQ